VLPRADEAPCVLAPEIAAHNRCSIAALSLPASVGGCLSQLQLELSALPHAAEHLGRLSRHYQPERGWAQAFAGVLCELFEPEGLLVIDPRDPQLAAEALPVTAAALERWQALGQALSAQGAALAQAGFAETVHVRTDSPLCFYHPDGAHGPRTRLVARGAELVEPDTGRAHTLPALLSRLEREPLCFSSSALLRPLVQDWLLPSAAYVGGPAEVAYYAQLPPLYAALGLAAPLVVPRARVRLIEPRTRRLLERLQLTAADAARSEAELLTQLNTETSPDAPELEAELQRGFEQTLSQALEPLPEALRGQLARQADRTRRRLAISAGKLAQAYGALRLRADETRVAQVRRLQQRLHPLGAPQERVLGLPYFGARYGDRALVARVLSAVVPDQPSQILELDL
jgi:bacillithiol biosynthesis cysteine-adding enzyme BshC